MSENLYNCGICEGRRASSSKWCPHCGARDVHWKVLLARWGQALLVLAIVIFVEKETQLFTRLIIEVVTFVNEPLPEWVTK